jgi:predicted helicase
MAEDAFDKYLSEINKAYLRGDATEHTHRPALKAMIEALGQKITATNEPRRQKCGAPDFIISRRLKGIDETVGYIETKDIGTNLTQEAKSEQIKKRYLASLHNFILTDYIEFRWYVNGEPRITARLAEEQSGKFKLTEEGTVKVSELLEMFLSQEPEKITSAKDLAVRMAGIARLMREIINKTFAQEEEEGTLHGQLQAFREVLIHDLTEEQFADMYAQTICYGLFSARCHIEDITLYGQDKYAAFHGMDDKSKELTRKNAAYLLPKTNPFLRRMFDDIAGINLDDRIAWLVDDLVTLLENSQMDLILQDFAKKLKRKDPVVHFYETFLAEFDPKLKKTRGVYYTPDEVVSYIVRSVDILLKKKFGLKRGLADDSKIKGSDLHKLLILDPAVGTGTFLFEVIDQIQQKFKTQKGAWSSYVKDNLLPRLFGFELMMAPYAVAHMKLGLQLAETGYDFSSDERLRIYLTNTLEEAEEISKNVFVQWLSEEAKAASKIKRELPIMVVLGNPPYSGHSANRSWEIVDNKKVPNFIGRLLKDYYEVDGRPLGEKNPKWLQDDYVKFIRFGQWRIEQTGVGILGFITNHSYLDNPTFRGMRQQLMKTFSDIYILDLHGSQKKKETCPDGSKDVNVFDIQQGVAIAIFVREADKTGVANIHHADLFGLRKIKYDWLMESDIEKTDWKELKPQKPFYLFTPQNTKSLNEFDKYPKITDVMKLNVLGFQTHRDDFAIDFDRDTIYQRVNEMRNQKVSEQDFRQKHNLQDNRDWKLEESRQNARTKKNWEESIIQCLYRPFDKRFCYFDEITMDYPRRELKDHVAGKENLCLGLGRQGIAVNDPEWALISVSKEPIDANIFRRGGINVFPLYLYGEADNSKSKQKEFLERTHWDKTKLGRVPNLSKEFVDELAEKINLEFVSDGAGDLKKTFGPEDIFHYIYAVFHSPTYRKKYAEFLKIDFPRVPPPKDENNFVELCQVGDELTKLHLMEAEILEDQNKWPAFNIEGSGVIENGYPKYIGLADKPQKGKVYVNKDQYFEGVRPEVWEFHIGGYQVCEKWLKDRRGRKLSYDDIRHYQKIAVALGETIRLVGDKCLVEMFEDVR